MRRAYSEITDQTEIRRILNTTAIGRLATQGTDGYPYITPVNFVLLGESIYFHSATEGEKLLNIQADARVCFEVDVPLAYLEMGFNAEPEACRVHQLYHCVIIRGLARIVPDGDLKTAALNALVAKHEGHARFPSVRPGSAAYRGCSVVEVRPERLSAKSDLLQNKPAETRREIAEKLVRRGKPGDLQAARALGFSPPDESAG